MISKLYKIGYDHINNLNTLYLDDNPLYSGLGMTTRQITLGEETIEYSLKRSNRKTIGLLLAKNGDLVVRAPKRTSIKVIEATLHKKKRWILQKRKLFKGHAESFQLDSYPYMGENNRLEIAFHEKKRPVIYHEANRITLLLHQGLRGSPDLIVEERRKLLLKWYRENARRFITAVVSQYEKKLNLDHKKIYIKSQKTRWGSCSSKKNLNFNWRVIMLPKDVAIYIIVHELCHLVENNHSKQFWKNLGAIIPDYKEKKAWLKKYGYFILKYRL